MKNFVLAVTTVLCSCQSPTPKFTEEKIGQNKASNLLYTFKYKDLKWQIKEIPAYRIVIGDAIESDRKPVKYFKCAVPNSLFFKEKGKVFAFTGIGLQVQPTAQEVVKADSLKENGINYFLVVFKDGSTYKSHRDSCFSKQELELINWFK